MCQHQPLCPDAAAVDRDAARVLVSHPEQGWSLLCNGVVVFDDAGDLLPDGHAHDAVATHLLPSPRRRVRALVAA